VPVEQALKAELNKKYANRVLLDVGLCICVFDISEASEGRVRYGDGMLWYKGEPLALFMFNDGNSSWALSCV
jgi:DNA-directed RNA polymerase III subunit RPC8